MNCHIESSSEPITPATIFFAFLALMLLSAPGLTAQWSDLGRPMENHDAKVGTLLVRADDHGQQRPIPLVATETKISVTGMIARTIVTQHFTNPTDQWLEGEYVFPLPDTAAVDTLVMTIGDREIIGEIKETAKAKKIYNQAKTEGKKASLLTQERPNIFTSSVANIGPGEAIVIRIAYQETLRYDRGAFSLRYPNVVAPRYIPGTRTISGFSGSGWGENTDQVVDAVRITPPYLDTNKKESQPTDGPIVRIQVHIDAGFPVTVQSKSHDIRVSSDSNGTSVELKDNTVPADRDFVLEWRPQVGAGPHAALFSDVFNDETYALVMIMPPDSTSQETKPLPREVIYVIDTSGSMDGASIRQAKSALTLALTRLSPDDHFDIIAFNSSSESLFKGTEPATLENIQYAVGQVKKLSAQGGTEILSAVRMALRNRKDTRRVRQVIFMTDGSIGNEGAVLKFIRKHLGQSRLFTIGIGSAPNGYFMRKAAELGRGTFTYIGKTSEVKEKMGELFAKLQTPVLNKIQVDWKSGAVEHFPKRIPDLYAGEPVVIVARLPKLGGNVEISGWRGKTPWAIDFKLEGGRSHSGVDRLYARKKIEGLSTSLAEGASKERVRKEIVELGLAHHLVTRHTSLVAVEQVVSRPKEKKLKTSAVPSNLPLGFVYDSVFGNNSRRVPDAKFAQKSLEERRVGGPQTLKVYEVERKRKRESQYERKIAEQYERKMAEELRQANVVLNLKVDGPLMIEIAPQVEDSSASLAADATSSAVVALAPQKKEHKTAQPTAIAKLQALAGIIPKTATPAALLLIVGLGLLLLAWYFRSRRNSARTDIVKG